MCVGVHKRDFQGALEDRQILVCREPGRTDQAMGALSLGAVASIKVRSLLGDEGCRNQRRLRLASLRTNRVALVWNVVSLKQFRTGKPDNATVTCRCRAHRCMAEVAVPNGPPPSQDQGRNVAPPRPRASHSFFGFYLFPLHTLSGKEWGLGRVRWVTHLP